MHTEYSAVRALFALTFISVSFRLSEIEKVKFLVFYKKILTFVLLVGFPGVQSMLFPIIEPYTFSVLSVSKSQSVRLRFLLLLKILRLGRVGC